MYRSNIILSKWNLIHVGRTSAPGLELASSNTLAEAAHLLMRRFSSLFLAAATEIIHPLVARCGKGGATNAV